MWQWTLYGLLLSRGKGLFWCGRSNYKSILCWVIKWGSNEVAEGSRFLVEQLGRAERGRRESEQGVGQLL